MFRGENPTYTDAYEGRFLQHGSNAPRVLNTVQKDPCPRSPTGLTPRPKLSCSDTKPGRGTLLMNTDGKTRPPFWLHDYLENWTRIPANSFPFSRLLLFISMLLDFICLTRRCTKSIFGQRRRHLACRECEDRANRIRSTYSTASHRKDCFEESKREGAS